MRATGLSADPRRNLSRSRARRPGANGRPGRPNPGHPAGGAAGAAELYDSESQARADCSLPGGGSWAGSARLEGGSPPSGHGGPLGRMAEAPPGGAGPSGRIDSERAGRGRGRSLGPCARRSIARRAARPLPGPRPQTARTGTAGDSDGHGLRGPPSPSCRGPW